MLLQLLHGKLRVAKRFTISGYTCHNMTMELLSQYVYSSSQSESSVDELQPAKVRSVYLIAYSQPLILNFITTPQVFAPQSTILYT